MIGGLFRMSKNKKAEPEKYSMEVERVIALKDFVICQNDYRLEIKKGDDLSNVPDKFIENLKTEKVI